MSFADSWLGTYLRVLFWAPAARLRSHVRGLYFAWLHFSLCTFMRYLSVLKHCSWRDCVMYWKEY